MNRSEMFWQTYLNLEKELIEVSKCVYITDVRLVNKQGVVVEEACRSQLETFSPHIADLIIQCCVQIEALSKELYFDIGGIKQRGDINLLFDEDCLKEIDKKWSTHNKVVQVVSPLFNLTKDENRILKPLREAHKRKGTYWEKAYQAVKHDRYTSLYYGNIKALMQCMAALYLLNLYSRNDILNVCYKELGKMDMSMGSAVFSVMAPKTNQLWYGNNPEVSESPYVVRYRDSDYQRIKEIQDKEERAIDEYWKNQPEHNEPDFIKQLEEAAKKNGKIMVIWELGKYRINKKIHMDLPFEERKKMLLSCREWQGWIHQHNGPKNADEITEENIQKEIDILGVHTGMEIMKKYQPMAWVNYAMTDAMCEVKIG